MKVLWECPDVTVRYSSQQTPLVLTFSTKIESCLTFRGPMSISQKKMIIQNASFGQSSRVRRTLFNKHSKRLKNALQDSTHSYCKTSIKQKKCNKSHQSPKATVSNFEKRKMFTGFASRNRIESSEHQARRLSALHHPNHYVLQLCHYKVTEAPSGHVPLSGNVM